jgi:hypothetical protein
MLTEEDEMSRQIVALRAETRRYGCRAAPLEIFFDGSFSERAFLSSRSLQRGVCVALRCNLEKVQRREPAAWVCE